MHPARYFYKGAARIERFLEKPSTERFMDAVTMWYMIVALVFVVVCLGFLAIAFVTEVLL